MDESTEAVPEEDAPPARILVTGTLAIDHACRYPGTFATLPQHRGINLSIQLDSIDRRFGGCAMNIAYTLKLLGDDPVPFVFVGRDYGGDYAAHLQQLGMDTSGIQRKDEPYSSHAFIFTDSQQNQFTGFYGGPSTAHGFAPALRRYLRGKRFEYAIVAPDVPSNMIAAARALSTAGIPFLTDPGQNLTDFQPQHATALMSLSSTVVVNEFEYRTLAGYVGAAIDQADLTLVTEGARGIRWHSRQHGSGRVQAVAANVVDPTGCGDAFRGGFVHARLRGAGLRDAVRAGAVTAAIVLERHGTQTHACDDFAARYQAAWGDSPPWG